MISWNEITSRAENEGRTYLMEHECKELLEKQGISHYRCFCGPLFG